MLRAIQLADPGSTDSWRCRTSASTTIPRPPSRSGSSWCAIALRGRSAARGMSPPIRGVILAFSLTDVADMLDLQLLLGGSRAASTCSPTARPTMRSRWSTWSGCGTGLSTWVCSLWDWNHQGGGCTVKSPWSRPVRGFHASGHAGQAELLQHGQGSTARPAGPDPHGGSPGLWLELLHGLGACRSASLLPRRRSLSGSTHLAPAVRTTSSPKRFRERSVLAPGAPGRRSAAVLHRGGGLLPSSLPPGGGGPRGAAPGTRGRRRRTADPPRTTPGSGCS